jgi:hypothetical protein
VAAVGVRRRGESVECVVEESKWDDGGEMEA